MGWIAALFMGLLAWVLVRDIQCRETGLITLSARRESRPAAYWAIVAFWLLCFLFCALLVLTAYLRATACDGRDPCIVIVRAPPQ